MLKVEDLAFPPRSREQLAEALLRRAPAPPPRLAGSDDRRQAGQERGQQVLPVRFRLSEVIERPRRAGERAAIAVVEAVRDALLQLYGQLLEREGALSHVEKAEVDANRAQSPECAVGDHGKIRNGDAGGPSARAGRGDVDWCVHASDASKRQERGVDAVQNVLDGRGSMRGAIASC